MQSPSVALVLAALIYRQTLSHTLPAYCTGPPCWKRQKYWRILAPKIHWFSPNYNSLYIWSQASYKKVVKTKSDHHHCPIPVYILTTSKIEAVLQIHRWGLWLLKWGVGSTGGEGGLLAVPPSTCLASRWGGLPQAMRPGQWTFTILQLSLSLSPPSSVLQQAGRGLTKKSALHAHNKM